MAGTAERPGAIIATPPQVRKITFDDVQAALAAGVKDFLTVPAFGFVLGGIYALGGLAILASVFTFHLSYLAYPLLSGFVLIGPFIAAGLYEVSRELEAGRTPTWSQVIGTIFAQRKRELAWMAFISIFAMIIWLYQVRLLLALFLGFATFATFDDFARVLFTTTDGISFLVVGNVVGLILALAVFSITVISFPLLMDRDVDVVTAMITSVNAVVTNPGPMIGWGLVVVFFIALGCIPAFLLLPLALPVLGHTTWHLYRRAVVPLP